MWPYLEIGSLQMIKLKRGHLSGPPSSMTDTLKRKDLDMEMCPQRAHHVNLKAEIQVVCRATECQGCQQTTRTQVRGLGQFLPPSPQKGPTLPTRWSWPSASRTMEHFWCVSPQQVALRCGSLGRPIQWVSGVVFTAHRKSPSSHFSSRILVLNRIVPGTPVC